MILTAIWGRAVRHIFSAICILSLILSNTITAYGYTQDSVLIGDNVTYTYDDLGRLKTAYYRRVETLVSYSYDAAGNRTARDVDGVTLPTLALWNTRIFEGGKLYYGLYLTKPLTDNLTVEYEIINDLNDLTPAERDLITNVDGGAPRIATPGVDYVVPEKLEAIIPAGSNLAHVVIQTLDEPGNLSGADEDRDAVIIRLKENPFVQTRQDRRVRRGWIVDDDNGTPVFAIADSNTVNGREEGTIGFGINLSGQITQPHSVTVETYNGSPTSGCAGVATPGEDYIAHSEVMTFYPQGQVPPGVNQRNGFQNFEVQILDDAPYEKCEVVGVRLRNATNGATIGLGSIINGTAVGEIKDDEDIPTLRIANTSTPVGGNLDFVYWLSNATRVPVRFDWDAVDASAKFGQHFTSEGCDLSGDICSSKSAITIPPNTSTGTLSLATISPGDPSRDLSMNIRLRNAEGAFIDGARGNSTGTIRPNGSSNTNYFIVGSSVAEGQPLTFTVNRTGVVNQAHTLNYTITSATHKYSGATSTPGEDFAEKTGTITFPSGVSVATFSTTTVADADPELDEPVLATISFASGNRGSAGEIGIRRSTAIGTIEGDPLPRVSIENVEADEGQPLTFTATLNRDLAVGLSLDLTYGTYSSGTSDADYEPTGGVIRFEPGQRSKTIRVNTVEDVEEEDDETFQLRFRQTVNTAIIDTGRQPGEPGSTGNAGAYAGVAIGTIKDIAKTTAAVVTVNNNPEGDGNTAVVTLSDPTSLTGVLEMHVDTHPLTTGDSGRIFFSEVAKPGLANPITAFSMSGVSSLLSVNAMALAGSAGVAVPSFDYTPVTARLTFAPGETEKVVLIPTFDDAIAELDEGVGLRFSSASSSVVVPEEEATYIIDNDAVGRFSADNISVNEGNDIVFTVKLSNPSDQEHEVSWSTLSGVAEADSDFVDDYGTLMFAPGEMEKQVTITGMADSYYEGDETFQLQLSNATNQAVVETAAITATILDNDPKPAISVTDARALEGQDMVFTIVKSGNSDLEHSVYYRGINRSAIEYEDFAATSGRVDFAPGETERTVTIAIPADERDEGAETFALELYSPTNGAVLGDNYGTGTILEPGPADIDPAIAYFVPAGSKLNISMGAGAGGADNRSQGGSGGEGAFEVTAQNDFYMRLRQGKKGGDSASINTPLSDTNGGGVAASLTNKAGQGGGATAIAISSEGIIWTPAAILGAGGGAGYYLGGSGGGFDLSGTVGPNGGGGGATTTSPGIGGFNNGLRGGNGAGPGQDGLFGVGLYKGTPGKGDVDFGIGGGGSGTSDHWEAAGGGGGRYGGGGAGHRRPGGGGSGYFDATAWETIAGSTPTGVTTTTGTNAGNGYITFDGTAGDGSSAFDPTAVGPVTNPEFSVSDTSVNEASGVASFIVTRSGNTDNQDTVNFATANGTALAGADYTAMTGTLTFEVGDAVKTILVPILADDIADDAEDFTLTLVEPSIGSSITDGDATATIMDDLSAHPAPEFELRQETLTRSDTSWTAPKGVTEILTATGNGENGAVASIRSFSPGQVAGSETSDVSAASVNSFAQSQYNILNGLGSSFTTITYKTRYYHKPANTVFNTENSRTKTLRKVGTVGKSGSGWNASGSSSGHSWSISGGLQESIPGRNGAATVAFGHTFSGGSQGQTAPTLTYENISVVADQTYAIDIASGGSLTIEYMVPVGTPEPDAPVHSMFAVNNSYGYEGGDLIFDVTRSGETLPAATIEYATADGTATAGSDYTAAVGTISFAEGEAVKEVIIPVLNDTDDTEAGETLTITLSNPSEGGVIAIPEATGTLHEPEPEPVEPAIEVPEGAYLVRAGETINVTMAAGAGGGGQNLDAAVVPGGMGGQATFELTAANNFFMKLRVGKAGLDHATHTDALRDPNGGGAGRKSGERYGGQGGGASAIAISNDGVTWVPVAIVGAGGGSVTNPNFSAGGAGGGLNQDGTTFSDSYLVAGKIGTGATTTTPGIGGYNERSNDPTRWDRAGDGGAPGESGGSNESSIYPAPSIGGSGDALFGLGGGGAGHKFSGGGGGGGRFGGGGGVIYNSGGGGSGYWDAQGWQDVTGSTPTIITNETGANVGDGFITFNPTSASGDLAVDPTGASNTSASNSSEQSLINLFAGLNGDAQKTGLNQPDLYALFDVKRGSRDIEAVRVMGSVLPRDSLNRVAVAEKVMASGPSGTAEPKLHYLRQQNTLASLLENDPQREQHDVEYHQEWTIEEGEVS